MSGQTTFGRANDLVRLRLAWPLVVPLLVFGLAAGHELAYRLTVPSQIHDHTLDATGHGYSTI